MEKTCYLSNEKCLYLNHLDAISIDNNDEIGNQLDFLSLINPLCEEIDENSYQPSLSVNELWKLLEESKCLQLSILECYTVCSQKYSRNLQSIIYLVVGVAL